MIPSCIDLFAGCGGLSLGLGAAGFSTLFAIEAHADAFDTYRANLLDSGRNRHSWPAWLDKRAWQAQDVLVHHETELAELRGKVDLVAGGPPCQGFSMNGLRRPDDPRSKMVDVYLHYVEIVRPRLILLENVVGFRSMKHRTGGTYSDYTKRRLEAFGYDTWIEILRAADWGVPQRRPRFVLIAAPKGTLPGIDPMQRLRVARKAFLVARGLGPDHTSASAAISDLEESDMEPGLDSEWGHLGFRALKRSREAATPYQRLMRVDSLNQPGDLRLPRHSTASVGRMRDILDNCERGVCLRLVDRERLGIKKRSTTPLAPDGPAPTISTLPDDFVHYSKPRAMTVREHARLQSFPDWFSFKGPYTTGGSRRRDACPRFTQVGNAVPPLLAEALGEMLMGLLAVQKRDESPHLAESLSMLGEYPTDVRKIVDGDFAATL
ncbi:putative cytosine-specifi methyltransferase DdeI [Gluconacetobacter diazotrophicus PA1 5]|uniref:Cytosine-specific methyltransferase n=2 Tax=Gluconacetobacter diazotrophicus TaxID=33996 RepID=A9H9J6_GLUDA|nr:putative cytosine-specifi methyltransferase DdeI [Gluconacetobacter diazotrophicus PA1 5]